MIRAKEDLIDQVKESLRGIILEEEIVRVVTASIIRAHSIGFNDGMFAANNLRKQTDSMLAKALER